MIVVFQLDREVCTPRSSLVCAKFYFGLPTRQQSRKTDHPEDEYDGVTVRTISTGLIGGCFICETASQVRLQ